MKDKFKRQKISEKAWRIAGKAAARSVPRCTRPAWVEHAIETLAAIEEKMSVAGELSDYKKLRGLGSFFGNSSEFVPEIPRHFPFNGNRS